MYRAVPKEPNLKALKNKLEKLRIELKREIIHAFKK